MDEDDRRIRREAIGWSAGALLVAALAIFAAWRTVDSGRRDGASRHATAQAPAASGTSPRPT